MKLNLTPEQDRVAADIAAVANRSRQGAAASEVSPASDKGITAADQIAGLANQRRQRQGYSVMSAGPMA